METPLQGGTVEPPTKRRVLIVDDHTFFAGCLRALVDAESDLEVCGVTSDANELESSLSRLRPDVLVIDLTLRGESGLTIGQQLRAHAVETPILFMSTLRSLNARELASVPAAAFTAKSRTPAQFLAALRRTLRRGGNEGAVHARFVDEPVAAASSF